MALTDPDLQALESDLLALGHTATADAYNAAVALANSIETATPKVLNDAERAGTDRVINMLPAPLQTEAKLAAGVLSGPESNLNAEIAAQLKTEIGFVLQRLKVAIGA